MNYLPQFKSWLSLKGFSESTSRNYLLDLGKYLEYVNSLPQAVSLDDILTVEVIGPYVSYLSGKNNSARYLASLHKFCQFALDQNIISSDPFKIIAKSDSQPSLNELSELYQQHLTKHNTPISTVRNYINDINQYINWLNTTHQTVESK